MQKGICREGERDLMCVYEHREKVKRRARDIGARGERERREARKRCAENAYKQRYREKKESRGGNSCAKEVQILACDTEEVMYAIESRYERNKRVWRQNQKIQ